MLENFDFGAFGMSFSAIKMYFIVKRLEVYIFHYVG